MSVLRKLWQSLFCRQIIKPASPLPDSAIAVNRKDGNPYMWLWLDATLRSEPRIVMMFAQPNLRDVKIMWSAHVLPEFLAALAQLEKRQS